MMMNTLIAADGLELVTFSWEQLPAFVRGANRGAATPPPAYAALRPAGVAPRVEPSLVEEEPERWDGLS